MDKMCPKSVQNVYNHYGDFQFNFHEREVFAAHRELVVAVNEARRRETLWEPPLRMSTKFLDFWTPFPLVRIWN